MKRRTWFGSAAVVAMLTLAALPATAANAAEQEEEPVTLATFGYVPTAEEGVAEQADVEAQVAQVEAFEESSESSRVAAAAADPAYKVMAKWADNKGKTTVARAGNGTSWGLTKVQTLHHVNLNMVKKTTMFPRPTGGRTTQGNAIVYMTDAIEWECRLGICTQKRAMAVKAVIDNTRMTDDLQKGLITSYCMGVTVCPQWVINVAG